LAELHADLHAADTRLMLARVRAPVRQVLDRSGAAAQIGAENIYARILEAVAAHLGQHGGASAEVFEMSSDALQRLIQVIDAQTTAATGADRERLDTLRQRLQGALDAIDRKPG
jgi:hypothetical protein